MRTLISKKENANMFFAGTVKMFPPQIKDKDHDVSL